MLENDIPDPAITLEKPFNVPLPALRGDVPDEHPGRRHLDS